MADTVLQLIKRHEGSEEELIEALVNYDYAAPDADDDSWYDRENGPHPNSFAALQTIPSNVLPRTVLFEVYRRKGAEA